MNEKTIDALQKALAAEHAAIYGYGLVGARANDDLLPAVREAETGHRARRDTMISLLRDHRAEPVAAHAAYQTPFSATDHDSALRLAIHLEEGVAATWRYVLGQTNDSGLRQNAAASLTDAAVRAARWRVALNNAEVTIAFPGA